MEVNTHKCLKWNHLGCHCNSDRRHTLFLDLKVVLMKALMMEMKVQESGHIVVSFYINFFPEI